MVRRYRITPKKVRLAKQMIKHQLKANGIRPSYVSSKDVTKAAKELASENSLKQLNYRASL